MSFFASLDRRRWVTVIVTLALAFASGYLMEHVLTERTAELPDPPSQPKPPAAMQVPALRTPPVLPDRARERRLASDRNHGCRPRLFVNPAPAATLRVDLYAPCQPDAPVTLAHGEVTARTATDAKGRLHIRMPALHPDAEVTLELDGQPMTGRVEVPDADGYRHVVLAWQGPQALRINAYEFGASKREMGHVWSGAPKSPSRAVRGSGGYLTQMGDGSGESVEIYSFPVDQVVDNGVVRLVVEAEVSEANCDRELRAQAFQTGIAGQLVRTEIALAMPGCDRLGEIVRLQNLLRDMRLAGR